MFVPGILFALLLPIEMSVLSVRNVVPLAAFIFRLNCTSASQSSSGVARLSILLVAFQHFFFYIRHAIHPAMSLLLLMLLSSVFSFSF